MKKMADDRIILYIHGMGGGGDSRIPSILKDCLADALPAGFPCKVQVVVRTYDFDPEIAVRQISSWTDELRPALVIGESLGSLQALRIRGVPHLFVSPSLNAPVYFSSVTAPISGTASPVERNFIDVNSLSGYGFSRLVQ